MDIISIVTKYKNNNNNNMIKKYKKFFVIKFHIHVSNCILKMCMGMHGVKMRHSNVKGKLLELTVLMMVSPTNTFTFICAANHFFQLVSDR